MTDELDPLGDLATPGPESVAKEEKPSLSELLGPISPEEAEIISHARVPGWGQVQDAPRKKGPFIAAAVVGLLVMLAGVIPLFVVSKRAPDAKDPVVIALTKYGRAVAAGETPDLSLSERATLASATRENRPDGTYVLFAHGAECWALVIGVGYQPPQRAPGRC